MGHRHGRRDPASHIERTDNSDPTWVKCSDQVICNLVCNRLVKSPLISVGPQVQLEGLEFDAPLIRHVCNRDRGEIRLTRHRADIGELRADALDLKVSTRIGVRERLNLS